jgi:hypothetical protein
MLFWFVPPPPSVSYSTPIIQYSHHPLPFFDLTVLASRGPQGMGGGWVHFGDSRGAWSSLDIFALCCTLRVYRLHQRHHEEHWPVRERRPRQVKQED